MRGAPAARAAPPIFHLSLSVSDLERTRAFYVDRLGAEVGRATERWIDLWLFGAQLTVYRRPQAVVPAPYRHGQHFGATLEWEEWERLTSALAQAGVVFAAAPVRDAGTGVAKAMVEDPDGYLVELKAYRPSPPNPTPPGA